MYMLVNTCKYIALHCNCNDAAAAGAGRIYQQNRKADPKNDALQWVCLSPLTVWYGITIENAINAIWDYISELCQVKTLRKAMKQYFNQ